MKTHRHANGFTLIELMVVVIIIAALAGMVLPRVLPASDEAKAKIASGDIANISVALKLFRLHNDVYPSTQEGLDILLKPSSSRTFKESYLERKPLDPWKRKYQYRYPATRNTTGSFDLWSLGIDGKDGTDDDVTNWEE